MLLTHAKPRPQPPSGRKWPTAPQSNFGAAGEALNKRPEPPRNGVALGNDGLGLQLGRQRPEVSDDIEGPNGLEGDWGAIATPVSLTGASATPFRSGAAAAAAGVVA